MDRQDSGLSLWRMGVFLCVSWTAVIAVSLFWNISDAERTVLELARMQARAGHYMKPAMLASQFAALEPQHQETGPERHADPGVDPRQIPAAQHLVELYRRWLVSTERAERARADGRNQVVHAPELALRQGHRVPDVGALPDVPHENRAAAAGRLDFAHNLFASFLGPAGDGNLDALAG